MKLQYVRLKNQLKSNVYNGIVLIKVDTVVFCEYDNSQNGN